MNTAVYALCYGGDAAKVAAVETLFRRQEAALSRFDPASDLSALNSSPSETCAVSSDLYAALEVALWAAQATAGLYDPSLLRVLAAAGYDRSFEQLAAPAAFIWEGPEGPVGFGTAPVQAGRPTVDSVVLDPGARTVRRPVGLQFDLGGMGKGWAVDRAADRLHAHRAFLVNAGGDLYAQGQPGDDRGWRIALEHPLHPDRWMAQLFVQNRGLATSSIMKRRWRMAGRLAHHLIDPRTGQPAQTDALSVTVLAPRTVLAEIYAKAALILGAEAGLAYLETLPDVEGLIFTAAGRIAYTAGFAPLLDALDPVGTSFVA